ncbi:caskin-2-like [Zalophus californianus]|uniref:Caskin-2-like n=1 Tax=Zalophus californianus TaxID=9704 RepID=A0A6P9FIT3_ZALCA|nr:caskin-2-like [Zalophus californianus]
MPLVHSSHSCTICRQPRSPRRAPPPPPRTHTPAYLLRPERPPPPRRLNCPRSLFVALSHTQPNPGPAAQPLASRVGGNGERARQPQRWAGTPEPPGVGGAAAPLQLLAG